MITLDSESLKNQAKLLRREYRRAAQKWRYRRLDLHAPPVLFANSFPKSGTHLLVQALQGFTRLGPAVEAGLPPVLTYQKDNGQKRDTEEIRRDLERLRPGDIAYGHLHAEPELVSLLCGEGFAAFFIIRDPRDVVVSHVHYVTEMSSVHAHHEYYAEVLQDFDQRLSTSILGRSDWEEEFPDIQARFEPFLGWLNRDEVLTIRYEDFIHERKNTLRKIIDFTVLRGFPLLCDREQAIGQLEASIDPQKSPTFRSGKTGGWRDQFTPEHKALFKQVGGELLIQLGYEYDNDW
jgi:hypothetical protein